MKTRVKTAVVTTVLAVCISGLLSGKAEAAAFADSGKQTIVKDEASVLMEVKNGWVDEADGRKYYENDVAKTGTMVPIPDASGSVYYYSFDANGNMLYGIVTGADGALYYHANTDATHPGAAVSSWQQIGDKTYYFDTVNYQASIGFRTLGTANYFFENDGSMAVNTWKTVGENTYYFGADGQTKSGFVTIDNVKYYFNQTGSLAKSTFVTENGKTYYIGKNGKVTVGLKKINGQYYYFTKSGKMKTSAWVKIDNDKYYVSKSGKAFKGPHKIKGKVYVFKSNGKLVTKSGFVTVSKKTYYLNKKGVAQTGYKKIGDDYYYFGTNGVMYKKKWAYVDGYKFYFNGKGKRSVNVDKKIGKQDTYQIVVNKYSNIVTVYAKDGDKGYTIPVKAFICSPGASTELGTYQIKNQYRWQELMGPCWGQWCSRIYDGVLFHSVYYNKYNDNNSLSVSAYNKLGTTCSHGCVRLTAGDAKWIYDNCSVGTTVKIISKKGKDPFPQPKADKLSSSHTWDPTDPNMKYKCKKNGCH